MATTQESIHMHYTDLDDRSFQIGGRTLFFLIVLFAAVVTATLLFLYARWVYKFSNILPITNPHAPPHTLESCGLGFAVVGRLPITLHRSLSAEEGGGAAEEEECCICLGVIEEGEKVKVLPTCRHCYHSECVDRWLLTQSTCPLCRTPLRLDSDVVPAVVVGEEVV